MSLIRVRDRLFYGAVQNLKVVKKPLFNTPYCVARIGFLAEALPTGTV
jgi:hypothetical protein